MCVVMFLCVLNVEFEIVGGEMLGVGVIFVLGC